MKPKQFFYVLIGIIGALVVVSGVGYYYALNMLESTKQSLATQQEAQAAADDQLEALNRVLNQYQKDVVPILPLMDEALPHTKNQTEILAQLQRIAADTGLNLGSVTFTSGNGLPSATSQTVASGGVLALPINFQVTGTYTQLQAFLTRVETLSRLTNVVNLAVTRGDKTKPLTYSMNVNAYMKP